MQDFIPFHVPLIGEPEIERVTKVLRSGWLTTGPVAAQFEREFAAYTQARHALAVNSATAALHLALAALGIGPGDEVITTPLTFCATVNTIIHVGARPVLADIDATLNIDPARVEAAVTPCTRAILPVHFAGLPCDMARLWELAVKHRLAVVEDAAHAIGARWNGVSIGGGESQAVAFSFYATKNMTTGEGGMVTTPSPDLHERMRVLSLHGMSRHAWDRYTVHGSWFYDVLESGFKYNMSDITAALGLAQLTGLDAMTNRRREIAQAYTAAFADVAELQTPSASPGHCWHLYVLRLNLQRLTIGRDEFIEEMGRRGIGCSVHFIPIPLHSYYKRVIEKRDPCDSAVTEYPRLVSLPIYPALKEQGVQRVIEAVLDIVQHRNKKVIPAVEAGDAVVETSS